MLILSVQWTPSRINMTPRHFRVKNQTERSSKKPEKKDIREQSGNPKRLLIRQWIPGKSGMTF